ncbi:TPA: hypothetical protein ACH3X3_006251 [Trebouxia sp. C0006]
MSDRGGQGGFKDGSMGAVNVQVILRCRPCSKQEVASRTPQIIQVIEANKEVVLMQSVAGKHMGRAFHYDKVFGPESSQERLYTGAIAPIVSEVLEGFNCTIFAYGQTGTGKTYTMEGGDRNSADGKDLSEVAGVIPRAISQIFQHLDSINSEYTVKCSFLELYNEETTDLLAVGESKSNQKLRMLEDKSGVNVQGLEEIIVKSSADIYTLLDRGSAKRRTAETLLNKQSSRSHSVFCITVHMRETPTEGEDVIKVGKLYLVDLAGSENVGRSGAVDVRAKEAGLINKSLLTLGRVITALVEQSGHIPYRDSKLTRLLRDSLGGRTKTCIIATIAPTVQCQEETLSTLDYAHRAKNIRNRPEVNQRISKAAHIKELNSEIDKLKEELFATREKNGVYLPADHWESQQEEQKFLQQRVETLQKELEIFADRSRHDMEQLKAELNSTQEELRRSFAALNVARQGIQERDFLIATHERSEHALAGHANSLCSELDSAAQEVNHLFDRLESTAGREDSNAQIVQQLRQGAEEQLQAMDEAVSSSLLQQQELYRTIQHMTGQFMQQKSSDLAAMQGQITQLQGQVGKVSKLVSRSGDAASMAATQGFQQVAGLQTANAQQAHQAAEASATWMQTAFGALTEALSTQTQQLETYASQQRTASTAMLQHTQAAIALARQHLHEADAATTSCRQTVDHTLDSHSAALNQFDQQFASSMQEEQAKLVEQIGSMLSSFTQRKTEEVSRTVATIHSQLDSSRHAVGSSFAELATLSASTAGHFQVEESAAVGTSEQQAQLLQETHNTVTAALEQVAMHGHDLRGQANEVHANDLRRRQDYSMATDRALTDATNMVQQTASRSKQQATQGFKGMSGNQTAMLEDVNRAASRDEAALGQVQQTAARGEAHVQDFCQQQIQDIVALTGHVNEAASTKYFVSTEGLPARRPVEVPPSSWIEDMRTPAADLILMEFHRQKYSTEGEADGQENTSPNSAFHTDPAPQPESPISEESGAAHVAKSSSGGSQVFEARALASTGSSPAASRATTPSRIKTAFEEYSRNH